MKHARPHIAARAPGLNLACFVAAAAFGGCSSTPKTIANGEKYPTAIRHVHSVDIQVFRRDTVIEFTNTTARAYGPSTLWLNGRFSRPIDGLDLGQTMVLPLKSFKDEFGEAFRGGGFWATQKPEHLGLAELQCGDEMIGLIVVGNEVQ